MNFQAYFQFIFLSLFSVFVLVGCTIETIDEPDSDISDSIAIGATDAGVDFTTRSALVEEHELFDDNGYYFHLFGNEKNCPDTPTGFSLNGDIRFFIDSDTPLQVQEYSAKGPFITSTSFFGCTVVITSIVDDVISGKVRGGDPDGDKWVEGAFEARLCYQ